MFTFASVLDVGELYYLESKTFIKLQTNISKGFDLVAML